MPTPYEDILHLPHPVSATRRPMSLRDRAAQFAPFAALTGHDAAIRETARLTDCQADLDEDQKALLNRQLQYLLAMADRHPEITVTFFQPDTKKDGGAYKCVTACLQSIDLYTQPLVLADRLRIPIDRIYALEGNCFPDEPELCFSQAPGDPESQR